MEQVSIFSNLFTILLKANHIPENIIGKSILMGKKTHEEDLHHLFMLEFFCTEVTESSSCLSSIIHSCWNSSVLR